MKSLLFSLLIMAFSTLAYSQYNEIHLSYPDTFNIRAVSEKNGTLYCIASRYKTYLFNRTFLLKSTDAGDSWTVLKQFTLTKNPIFYSAVNDSVHYLAFSNYSNYILKTTDMFNSIDTINLLLNQPIYFDESFYAINKDTVVFNGGITNKGRFLFVTRDGFQSLDTVFYYNDSNITKKSLHISYNRRLTIANDTTWYAIAEKYNPNYFSMIKTQDAGVTWDTVNNQFYNQDINGFLVQSIDFIGDTGLVISRDYYGYKKDQLFLTTGGGNNFSAIDSFKYVREAQISRDGSICSWDGMLLKYSNDYGQNWETNNINLYYSFFASHPIYIHDSVIIIDYYDHNGDYFHKLIRLDLKTLSISQKEKKHPVFSAFPNPLSNSINIHTNENFSGKIRLFDIQGRILIEKEMKNNVSIMLDCTNLSPGIYFVKLVSESGKSNGVVKVIKN